MTPNMSLEKWEKLGQLSREMWYYKELCERADLDLIIYSYGRNDDKFLRNFPNATVLSMHSWIPKRIPFKIQNLIYNISSIFIYRNYFKKVKLSKTNQFSAAKFGLFLKIVYSIPLVIRMGFYHSHFKKLSFKKRIEEKILFRMCNLVLTTSFEAAKFIIKNYGISENKILSLCNSIDLNIFKPKDAIKEYDVLFVGRLEKVKNIKLLLSVINKSKLKALIIGKGSLSTLVKDAMAQNHLITWKERVDNIELPDYYNRSKCFIIVSNYEGNPKALLEAMACGIPSVATNVPGIRECVNNDKNGLLVNGDSSSVSDVVVSICKNEYKAKELGLNARKWVEEHSDFNKNLVKEINFYSLLKN